MAEEAPKGALDKVLDSIVGTINGLIMPPKNDEKGPVGEFVDHWFGIHTWSEWVGGKGVSRGMFLIALYFPLLIAAEITFPGYLRLVIGWLYMGFPIFGPVALSVGFWAAWMWYIRSLYIFKRTNPVLLEVKMPTDIFKSPRAMEQVLTSFWIRAGETTEIDRYWFGGTRPYSSLEICSFGGEVHFFIWIRSSYRNMIEAAMYSQYPEVEIVEAEDYASRFEFDPALHNCFVTDYVYDNRHQDHVSDVYPIKTYVDFELDKDPKEEFKVEPYASVIEVLGAMNKDEQAWVQIVIRGYFAKDWLKSVEKEVQKIRDEASLQVSIDADGNEVTKTAFPRPTETQKEQMIAMERQLSKLPFECGLRGIYIAPAGKMRSAEYTAIRWLWRPFNDPNVLNAIRPKYAHNDFDYPWQDWGDGPDGVRWILWTRRYLDMYRRRQFFSTPWQINEDPIHMSTEILATLWHPPSRTVTTPGLQRIPTAKSAAPPNLPM